MSWGYWLFLILGVLALARLVRSRMRLRDERRSPGPAEWVNIYGPLILVVGLIVAYALAGHVTRWFILILLVVGTLGPIFVTYAEKRSGAQRAYNARGIMFLIIAVCAGALVLSFVVRLVLVLLAMVAIFMLLILAAVLLGLVRPRQ
jgi:hypothetical protein